MTGLLHLDDTGMHPLRLSKEERALLRSAHTKTEAHRLNDTQGWMEGPFQKKTVTEIERLAKHVQTRFKRLLVTGIGGSDLGARTLLHALGNPSSCQVVFLSNPDPETVAAYLQESNAWWKETAVNVVSKSGTTLETMAVFLAVRERLVKAAGKTYTSHVYATTEIGKGALYAYAEKEGYTLIPHPLNVGGRFSVFTTVGLFPAAVAGISLHKLLKGAQWTEEHRRKEKEGSLVARYAWNQARAYQEGAHIQVLMPYADRLSSLGFWYRQLWSESLGKDGIGPTAVAAFGAIDQHSQIQLYNEGPNNKTVTFVEVEKFDANVRVPKEGNQVDGFSYATGKTFAHILHAEREGTARALSANKRRNSTITLPKISPETLGALLQFFMAATAYTGELLGINPYDQPGVEAGKKEAKKILSKQ